MATRENKISNAPETSWSSWWRVLARRCSRVYRTKKRRELESRETREHQNRNTYYMNYDSFPSWRQSHRIVVSSLNNQSLKDTGKTAHTTRRPPTSIGRLSSSFFLVSSSMIVYGLSTLSSSSKEWRYNQFCLSLNENSIGVDISRH